MKNPIRSRGTSLIEVLVALVVVSVGLLGIGKMQALAIESTRTSSVRSLIAVEAASIASAIHANEAYWQSVSVPFNANITVTSSGSPATPTAAISSSDGTMAGQTTNCVTSVCTASQMAAYDLLQWAQGLWYLTPTVTSSAQVIQCNGSPVVCTVQVNWTESTIGISGEYSSNATPSQQYVLVVQP